MKLTKSQWWKRFQKYYFQFSEIGLSIDLSRMNVSDAFFSKMQPKIKKALRNMASLEAGAIANPDENRMVGHYWLRNPSLAPTAEIRREIENTLADIKKFAAKIHSGKICGRGGKFKNYLLIGIGGSALGPQFVAHALGDPRTDKMKPYFFDNTDPDGMERVLATIGSELNQTLTIVISKSGGTKETRNGMLTAKHAYEKRGLNFEKHAVAVTMIGSGLDKVATKWITRFPMWDWIGGRTSELSAVGLLPAALQGIEIDEILKGASDCDKTNRAKTPEFSPSMLLSLAWHEAGNGNGQKNMVMLPYKDRLELFSKYLQQLVMESLGKEKDLNGKTVNQGITVLGNKGATDQHSYIQQLRAGPNDFFATFIQVLNDQKGESLLIDNEMTVGDFLHGFYLGTRQALTENERESVSIIITEISPYAIGLLIALFERAVGFYASFVNVNAYNQPGVEAGKKAADNVVAIQHSILGYLKKEKHKSFSVNDIVNYISYQDSELVYKICEHLASNERKSQIKKVGADSLNEVKFEHS